MLTRLRAGTWLVLSACTLSAPALAEAPPGAAAPSPSGEAVVSEHVRRGGKARNAGRWEEAAAAYGEALEAAERVELPAEKRALIFGELGLCELELGKHRDAAEHLHEALSRMDELPPVQRQRFLQGQKKAELEISLVFVGVDPPDAELLIDGKPHFERKASHVLFVEPGQHTLRARLAGHVDDFTNFSAPRGSWVTLTLSLAETPPKPNPKVGANSRPAPRRPAPTPAPPSSRGADVAGSLRLAGIITASAAVVGGTAFAIGGAVVDDQIERRSMALSREIGPKACLAGSFRDECESLRSQGRTRDTLDGLAVGSFITGAAIGALTLSSLWWAPSERSRAPIQVTPTVTAKQAGAVLSGVW